MRACLDAFGASVICTSLQLEASSSADCLFQATCPARLSLDSYDATIRERQQSTRLPLSRLNALTTLCCTIICARLIPPQFGFAIYSSAPAAPAPVIS